MFFMLNFLLDVIKIWTCSISIGLMGVHEEHDCNAAVITMVKIQETN